MSGIGQRLENGRDPDIGTGGLLGLRFSAFEDMEDLRFQLL